MAAAVGKPFEAKKPFKKEGHKQMAYLTATIKSLVKKGLKKAAKSKKQQHCSYILSSSDSDSEEETRCRDMLLDISSHQGKRSYLPWEKEFPRRYIPSTLTATL
jgi:hypothetical protein